MTDENQLGPGSQLPSAEPERDRIPARAAAPDTSGSASEPPFVEYARLVRRSWRTVAVFSAAFVALAFVSLLATERQYTAEAKLLIERQTPRVLIVEGVLADGTTGDEPNYYRTQQQILESRRLAIDVIRELSLDRDPHFAPKADEPRGLIAGWIDGLSGDEDPAPDPSGIDPGLVAGYVGRLSVSPVLRTRLLVVRFTSPDPQLSADVVNAHVQAFIRQGLRLRNEASEDARAFLESKLVELKRRLETSEVALNAYRRDTGMLSLDEGENIVVDRLSSLNEMLSRAEAERIRREAEAKLIQSRDYDTLPEVAGNTLIQAIKRQIGELEADYVSLSSQFKPTYPAVQRARARLDEMRERLDGEIGRTVAAIESAYLAAVDNEAELRQKLEQQKAAVFELKDASVRYAILKRETDSNRSLYESVLERMKEVGIAGAAQASNVSVIEPAIAPLAPSSPRRALWLMVALLGGLGTGVAFVFGRESFDSSLDTPEEVERYLRLPNLAVIPDLEALPPYVSTEPPVPEPQGTEALGTRVARARERVSRGSAPRQRISPRMAYAVMNESYRAMRTGILFSRPEAPPRTMLFTSAVPFEGKTTSVLNTAMVFSQIHSRVLVIDADLRLPRCHELLKVNNSEGLTDVLTGHRDLAEVIRETPLDGVDLVSAGKRAPNPTELVGSNAMARVLAQAAQDYDQVIVDAPPVMAVSDAVVLSPLVQGVVLVLRAHSTPRQIVQRAEARLRQARANILGVLLNKVDARCDEYSTAYGGRYYSPYYDEGGVASG